MTNEKPQAHATHLTVWDTYIALRLSPKSTGTIFLKMEGEQVIAAFPIRLRALGYVTEVEMGSSASTLRPARKSSTEMNRHEDQRPARRLLPDGDDFHSLPSTPETSGAAALDNELIAKVTTINNRDVVMAAEELVLANLPKRLTDGVLAQAVGVKVTGLRHAFQEVRGTSIYHALYVLRLRAVTQILEIDPSRSPEAVAFECGFGHYGVFHRNYRREFGTEPGASRPPRADTPRPLQSARPKPRQEP